METRLRLAFDPPSRLFLRRFSITLGSLTFAAGAIAPQALLASFAGMTLVAAHLDAMLAVLRRERLLSPSLSYWDGAAGFLAASCLAHLLA